MRWVRPKAVPEGGVIGVVSPAGPVDKEGLDRGVSALESAGFRIRLGPHALGQVGYLSGTDEERAADLNAMFCDPEIHAIVCARGGYGCTRILSMIDYDCVRQSRKPFAGYSDITAFHLAIQKRCRMITFHGMTLDIRQEGRLNDYSLTALTRALTAREPLGVINNPPGTPAPEPFSGGLARGRLTGGNLTLIVSSLGTPYEIDTRGSILVIEEVSEKPYRIDRMLRQLKLSGKLERIAGVVLGEFVDCAPEQSKPSFTLEEVLRDYFSTLGVPVIYGLRCGHGDFRTTLPMGAMAELDGDRGVLSIVEPATA